MGSVYAALFADAGHEVVAVDTWGAHIDAINRSGLRVSGASGDRTITSIRGRADLAEAGPCDLYILATKADGVGAAAHMIAPQMGPETLVLTIQNGLGAAERIAAHMPTDNVLLGVAEGFGASMKSPGHAHHDSMKRIRIGEIGGGLSERLTRLEAVWRGAGFDARAYADIDQLVWEKFICNCAFSAPCTVFNWTIGEVMANPESWAVALGCAREAYEIGRALGVAISFEDPDAEVAAFGAQMPNARPSMLLDHLARRPSEIDAINGMAPRLAARLARSAPFNQTVSAIVRAREATFGPR